MHHHAQGHSVLDAGGRVLEELRRVCSVLVLCAFVCPLLGLVECRAKSYRKYILGTNQPGGFQTNYRGQNISSPPVSMSIKPSEMGHFPPISTSWELQCSCRGGSGKAAGEAGKLWLCLLTFSCPGRAV